MTTPRWQVFVELDVSICGNIFGTAPCTATIGGDVTQRCFNSIGSCVDRLNYTETFVTLRFALDTGYQAESGIDYLSASLTDADVTPGVISLGENLGQRPSVTCTFRDHPYSDTGPGFDKYLSTRTYNPYAQGEFWAKFAARHPNLRGKKLRVIQGTLGQTLAQMETRHYIVDSFDGPSLDGTFTITAKDPLKALDGERAVAPAISNGVLNADIASGATSATLSPAGIGDDEYPGSGFVNIGGTEIASFTRSGNTLTITRGQKGSTAAAHSAGDRVQLCLVYTAQDPAAIIKDLEVTYGGIDTAYIPISDWLAETAAYNGQVYTATIAEPTSVKTLVAEVIEQAGLAHWWDEISETLRLQVLRQIGSDAALYDETIYFKGSLTIDAQPDKRISQCWTRFAQRDPTKGLDTDNLPGGAAEENLDSEADYGSSSIKTILSRWIPNGGRLIAENLNQIQLSRYLKPPRKVSFALVKAVGTPVPVPGAGYLLGSPRLQDVDGSRVNMPFQVTSIKLKGGKYIATGEELNYTDLRPDPFNRVLTVDFNAYNVNWRTLHDANFGSPQAGGLVTLQIASNARIGSSSGAAALVTGTWPSVAFTATRSTISKTLTSISDTSAFVVDQAVTGTGIPNDARVVSKTSSTVTLDQFPTSNGTGSLTLWTTILKLVNDGQVIGIGGQGGNGVGGDNNPGIQGSQGGTGLELTAPIDLQGAGKVDGGGGGGGGGGGDYRGFFGPQQNGGGGGGGAGDLGGSGGGSGGSGASGGGAGDLDNGGQGGFSNFSNFRGGGGATPGGTGEHAVGDFGAAGGPGGLSVNGAAFLKDSAFTGAYRGSQA